VRVCVCCYLATLVSSSINSLSRYQQPCTDTQPASHRPDLSTPRNPTRQTSCSWGEGVAAVAVFELVVINSVYISQAWRRVDSSSISSQPDSVIDSGRWAGDIRASTEQDSQSAGRVVLSRLRVYMYSTC